MIPVSESEWSEFFKKCVASRVASGDPSDVATDVCQGHQYGQAPQIPFKSTQVFPDLPPPPPSPSPFPPPDSADSPTAVKKRKRARWAREEVLSGLREVFVGLGGPRVMPVSEPEHVCGCPEFSVCACPHEADALGEAPVPRRPRPSAPPAGDGGGSQLPQGVGVSRARPPPRPGAEPGASGDAASGGETEPEAPVDEPVVCPEILAPVKTVDGVVYPNACYARLAGAKDWERMSGDEYDFHAMHFAGLNVPEDPPPARDPRAQDASPFGGMNPETSTEKGTDAEEDEKEEAIETLRKVFEGQSYGGYYAPSMATVKIKGGGDGFPFRTQAAQKVYAIAKRLITLYPEATATEIKGKAIDTAGVLVTELTPEDDLLLDVAIHYAQVGKDDAIISPPITGFSGAFGAFNVGGPPLSPRGYK